MRGGILGYSLGNSGHPMKSAIFLKTGFLFLVLQNLWTGTLFARSLSHQDNPRFHWVTVQPLDKTERSTRHFSFQCHQQFYLPEIPSVFTHSYIFPDQFRLLQSGHGDQLAIVSDSDWTRSVHVSEQKDGAITLTLWEPELSHWRCLPISSCDNSNVFIEREVQTACLSVEISEEAEHLMWRTPKTKMRLMSPWQERQQGSLYAGRSGGEYLDFPPDGLGGPGPWYSSGSMVQLFYKSQTVDPMALT